MIRSLRRRFLLIAMFSLALTLFVIGGSINLGNYIRLTDRADAIITTLYENDWNFPLVRNHPNVSGRFQLTRETEFETRYCIIHLDENEEPSDVNSEHIASLSESDISALTDAILSSGKDNGYWGYYRYHLYPSDGSSESDSGTLGDCRLLFAVTIILYSSAPDLLYYFRLSGSCTFTSPGASPTTS